MKKIGKTDKFTVYCSLRNKESVNTFFVFVSLLIQVQTDKIPHHLRIPVSQKCTICVHLHTFLNNICPYSYDFQKTIYASCFMKICPSA